MSLLQTPVNLPGYTVYNPVPGVLAISSSIATTITNPSPSTTGTLAVVDVQLEAVVAITLGINRTAVRGT